MRANDSFSMQDDNIQVIVVNKSGKPTKQECKAEAIKLIADEMFCP